jgi:hypothetical protein
MPGPYPELILPGVPPIPLWPGRRFAVRVVRADAASALVTLAGAELSVAVGGGARLRPGETVTLEVVRTDGARLALRLVRTA